MHKILIATFLLILNFNGRAQQQEFKQKIDKKGEYFSLVSMHHAAPYLFLQVSTSSSDKLMVFDTRKNQSVQLEGFYGELMHYKVFEKEGVLLVLTKYSTDKDYNHVPANCFVYDLNTLQLKKRIAGDMDWILALENNKVYGVHLEKLVSYSLETGERIGDIKVPVPSGYYLSGGTTFSNGKLSSFIDSNSTNKKIYWLDIVTNKNKLHHLPDSFDVTASALSIQNVKWHLLKKNTGDYKTTEAKVVAIDMNNGEIISDIKLSVYPSAISLNDSTGEVLVLGSSSSEIISLENGNYTSRMINAGGEAAFWTPGGNSIVFTDYNKLFVYDLNLAQEHMKIEEDYNGGSSFMEKIVFYENDKIYYADNNNDDHLSLGELKLDMPVKNSFDLAKLIIETKKETNILPQLVIQDGHQTKPTDIVFSSLNNRMITGDEMGNIIIWDADSKMQWNKIKLRKKNSWDENSLMKLAVHPQYEIIAASWTFGLIYFVDFYGNELYRLQIKGQSDILHFSEDGKYFFYEPDNGIMNVLRLEDTKVVTSYPFQPVGSIYNYAFDKTSERIAIPDEKGFIKILNALTGKQIDEVKTVHEKRIRSVAFHPSGKVLATLDELFNICITDIEKKESKNVIRSENERSVWQVLFDTKGNLLVPGNVGNGGKGSMYNILAGRYDSSVNHIREWTFYQNTNDIDFFTKMVVGKDERTLWSAHTNNAIEIWDAEQKVHLKTLNGNDEKLTEVFPGQDFNGLITSTSGKTNMLLKKWNFATAEIKPYNAVQFGSAQLYFNAADSTYHTVFLDDVKKISLQKDAVISSVEFDLYGHWLGNTSYGAIVNSEDKLWLLDPLSKKKKQLYNLKKDEQPAVQFDHARKNIFFNTNGTFVKLDLLSVKPSSISINVNGGKGKINCYDVMNDTLIFADNTALYTYDLSQQKHLATISLSRPSIFADTYYPSLIRVSKGGIVAVFYQADTLNVNDKRQMVLDVFRLNTNERKSHSVTRQEPIRDIMFSKDEQHLYIVYEKEVEIRSIQHNALLATLATLPDSRFIIYTPDNYYFTSQKLTDVGFRINDKVYDISQFDLKFNRPDIVLQRLGYADSTLVSLYRNAYEKRLDRSGSQQVEVSGIPEISITNRKNIELITSIGKTNISIQAKAIEGKFLNKLHIHINDVPITGMSGTSLNNATSFNDSISVKLTTGINKIRIHVIDNKGVASLKENLEIIYRPAEAVPSKLYFIGVGVSRYKDSAMNLTYADKDIKDLDSLFSNKHKDATSITLLNADATASSLLATKQLLMQTREEDMVIVSLSGHGLLNKAGDFFFASHETNFDDPERSAVTFSSLEWLLDSIPARKKLLLIDACHSGEVDRSEELITAGNAREQIGNSVVAIKPKGLTIRKKKSVGLNNSFSLMQELFNDLGNANGAIVISAAGGLEFALETAEYQNGVFTYALIHGLKEKKADANKDESVTIQELKSWLATEVFRLTKGRQKPTSRTELIDNNWVVWE